MISALAVAKNELRLIWRSRIARGGMALSGGLVLIALLVSIERSESLKEERARLAALAESSWSAQPDRHPHRVVHFGDFVFRPVTPLAAFDLGVEAFSGSVLFLEGHRQNPSNFSEADATGAVLRFSQLTPAFVLHTLIPLLLLFLGAGSIAGEREAGRLVLLKSLGVGSRSLAFGKATALFVVALLMLLPAAIWLLYGTLSGGDGSHRAWMILVGYTAYLAIWSSVVVAVSLRSSSRRTALLSLLGVWVLMVVIVPRLGASAAPLASPSPSRVESEIAVQNDLMKVGDSHNPQDPFFGQLRERTLAEHGVDRVEDLPFNYSGLVMLEGERLTTELYNQRFEEMFGALRNQSGWVSRLGWITPFQAVRNLSQRAAGVDLDHVVHFLAKGEARRYAMVQALNELHRSEIKLENDRGQRLSASNWAGIPRESYTPPELNEVEPSAPHGPVQLLTWLIVSVGGLWLVGAKR